MQRGNSLMSKLGGKTQLHDERGNRQWIHSERALTAGFAVYQARLLGFTEVSEARGTEPVREALKKIQFANELKRSEAGRKGSKLQKIEFHVSVDAVRLIDAKSKALITQKPLHRISYCADDHINKKVFAFIAKEDSNAHNCYALFTERDAAELTVTVGQAFELAYKRYLNKGKPMPKNDNNELVQLKQQMALVNAENMKLKQQLQGQDEQPVQNSFSTAEDNNKFSQPGQQTTAQGEEQPSLLVDFGAPTGNPQAQQDGNFDPFDNYLSKMAISRDFTSASTPDQVADRAPFQSPLQRNPTDNPFNPVTNQAEEQQSHNPFGSFFDTSAAPIANNGNHNDQNFAANPATYPAPISKGIVQQVLPPPPTKQSIKAANASKVKGVNSPVVENNSGTMPNAGNNGFSNDPFNPQMTRQGSDNSMEASLARGLQFDSYALGDLTFP
eukprot:gene3586-4091_t